MQALPLRMESHNILFDDLKRKSKSKSKVALTQNGFSRTTGDRLTRFIITVRSRDLS